LSESSKRSGVFVPEVLRSLPGLDDNSQILLPSFFFLTLTVLFYLGSSQNNLNINSDSSSNQEINAYRQI